MIMRGFPTWQLFQNPESSVDPSALLSGRQDACGLANSNSGLKGVSVSQAGDETGVEEGLLSVRRAVISSPRN